MVVLLLVGSCSLLVGVCKPKCIGGIYAVRNSTPRFIVYGGNQTASSIRNKTLENEHTKT